VLVLVQVPKISNSNNSRNLLGISISTKLSFLTFSFLFLLYKNFCINVNLRSINLQGFDVFIEIRSLEENFSDIH
jgi:hypothetical protein